MTVTIDVEPAAVARLGTAVVGTCPVTVTVITVVLPTMPGLTGLEYGGACPTLVTVTNDVLAGTTEAGGARTTLVTEDNEVVPVTLHSVVDMGACPEVVTVDEAEATGRLDVAIDVGACQAPIVGVVSVLLTVVDSILVEDVVIGSSLEVGMSVLVSSLDVGVAGVGEASHSLQSSVESGACLIALLVV